MARINSSYKRHLLPIVVAALVLSGVEFSRNSQAVSAEPDEYLILNTDEGLGLAQIEEGLQVPLDVITQSAAEDVVKESDGTISVAESVTAKDSAAFVLANPEDVTLVWELAPEGGPVTVTKNGVTLDTGYASDQLIDSNITPGTEYVYQISQVQEITEKSEDLIAKSGQLPIDQIVTMSLNVEVPESTVDFDYEMSTSTKATAEKTVLRYLTFIRDEKVLLPPIGCFNPGDYRSYFNGNGRGFDPLATASQSKTVLTAVIDWNARSISQYKAVSATELTTYQNGRLVVMYETANAGGIYVNVLNKTTADLAHFEMRHRASNPFCASGDIYYNLDVWVGRSGNYTVTGERVRVPDHEFYIRDDNQPWRTIWTRNISDGGFWCLNNTGSTECFSSNIKISGSR